MTEDLSKDIAEFLSDAPVGGDPEPEPEPTPAQDPEPDPTPDPNPEPTQDPEPDPEPTPTPTPDPDPEPEPEPTEREKHLMGEIEKLNEKISGMAPREPEPKPDPKVDPKVEPKSKEEPKPLTFLKEGEHLDDIIDDPEKFETVLNRVYEAGLNNASSKAKEEILKAIPQLVVQYTARQSALNQMVSDFYKKNADLVGVKKTVAAVTNEVLAENAAMKPDEMFEEVAKRTRQVLGMKAKVVNPEPNDPKTKKTPAFADQKGRKGKPEEPLKGLSKEVNDLIS